MIQVEGSERPDGFAFLLRTTMPTPRGASRKANTADLYTRRASSKCSLGSAPGRQPPQS